MNTFLIFIGAGTGGIFRYWIANGIYLLFGRAFPYGTLIVNISGCFLMGFLFTLIMDRLSEFATPLRSLILIGLLGGYTTFSSFSIETINLFESGAVISAILNIIFSVLLCIMATWLGVIGGRML